MLPVACFGLPVHARPGPAAPVRRLAHARGGHRRARSARSKASAPSPSRRHGSSAPKAVIHALVTNGTNLTHYANLGRYIPAALERALIERDQTGVALGCSVRDNLKIHHRDPVNNEGPTSLEDCGPA